jgi:hypothetical protein
MKTKTKSKKVNKNWLHDHINDPYVKASEGRLSGARGLQAQGN